MSPNDFNSYSVSTVVNKIYLFINMIHYAEYCIDGQFIMSYDDHVLQIDIYYKFVERMVFVLP